MGNPVDPKMRATKMYHPEQRDDVNYEIEWQECLQYDAPEQQVRNENAPAAFRYAGRFSVTP